MDANEYHRRLGIGESAFEDLLPCFETRRYEGLEYRHLPDYRRGLERGTVLIDGEVVRGFPKIPRTLVLSTGIPEQFGDGEGDGGDYDEGKGGDDGYGEKSDDGSDGRSDDGSNGRSDGPDEIAVEEKLNGYNVRVARIDGELLAFTRSGIVCPFTTRKLERLVDLEGLFDAHPGAMVCGEMIGPESPYTPHDYPEVDSLAFRAFDWRDRESGDPLPVAERRERYGAFGVPQTSSFGTYEVEAAAEAVDDVVDDLSEAGREGVVMKSPDGTRLLKYTTRAANQGDLAYAFSLPFDHGRSFMFRRLIRDGFQAAERDESAAETRERAHDLGEAILESMVETIERVEAGETVGEEHTVRGRSETIDRLLEHLDEQGLTVEVFEDERVGEGENGERTGEGEDGERVVTFCKVMQSTRDKTRNYLEGHVVTE